MKPKSAAFGSTVSAVVLAACLAQTPAAATAPPELATLLKRLRDNQREITSVRGGFGYTEQPTEWFVEAYHADTHSDRSLDEIRTQFTISYTAEFAQQDPLWRYLDIRYRGDGDGVKHERMAYDNRRFVHFRSIPDPDEAIAAEVHLSRNIIFDYGQRMPLAQLMGHAYFGDGNASGPASGLIAAAADAKIAEIREGDGILWQVVATDTRTPTVVRVTFWFDPSKGMALRRYTKAMEFDGAWRDMERWQIDRLAPLPQMDQYYPEKASFVRLNKDGRETFAGTLRVVSLDVNVDIPPGTFRPEIEDGSNVKDHLTGRWSVAGGKPSKRMADAIAAELVAGREKIAGRMLPQSRVRPRSRASVVPWLLVCGGIALVGGALWRRTRAQAVPGTGTSPVFGVGQ